MSKPITSNVRIKAGVEALMGVLREFNRHQDEELHLTDVEWLGVLTAGMQTVLLKMPEISRDVFRLAAIEELQQVRSIAVTNLLAGASRKILH